MASEPQSRGCDQRSCKQVSSGVVLKYTLQNLLSVTITKANMLLFFKNFLFYFRAKAEEKTEYHLNPLKALHCVDELMAEDSVIVADGGDFVGSAAYIMKPRGPLCWLDPGRMLLTKQIV